MGDISLVTKYCKASKASLLGLNRVLFKSPFSRGLCINSQPLKTTTMLRVIDKQAQLVEDEIKTLVDNDKQLKHQVKL
jgi:hypothetical protein